MNLKLLETIRKPSLYEKTDAAFWDDPHISAQMLEAHLNPEWEAASRKHTFIDASVEFIHSILPEDEYPRLLDIGCGPGLYTVRFVKKGYEVTGVDFSRRSIDYAINAAKKEKLSIDYHYQNYLTMELSKSFDLCTLIYCDYGALSTEDRRQVLAKVFSHLRSGGKFLFDVFTRNQNTDFQETRTYTLYENGAFFRPDRHLLLEGFFRYNDNIFLNQYTIITEKEVIPINIWDTAFSREELAVEVEEAGFRVCEVYTDVSGKPYQKDEKTMAFLVEKP